MESATLDLLVCPACQQSQVESDHSAYRCSLCGHLLSSHEGIIEGAWVDLGYREIPEETFLELLERAKRVGWFEAAKEKSDIPGTNPDYLSKITRADFRYLLPLGKNSIVLDAGAGLGTIMNALAPHVGTYVALENDLLRLRFARQRARQEALTNVICVHSSILNHPLAHGKFDVVILNGVLEWVGLEGTESPGKVQHSVIAELWKLLKPGGVIYVGTDNRFALAQLRGAPEPHTMLPFVGIMPRKMADRLVRRQYLKGRGWNRSPMLRKGFRTWTYSLWGYRKMLRRVGFEDIYVWLPHPTYNQPHRIISNAPQAVAFYVRQILGRRSIWHRTARTLQKLQLPVSWLRIPYAALASFFLFRARKPGGEQTDSFLDQLSTITRQEWKRLSMGGDPPQQFSFFLSGISPKWPKSALLFSNRSQDPVAVAKISRDAYTDQRLKLEHDNIQRFSPHVPSPQPPLLDKIQETSVLIRCGVSGDQLGQLLNHGSTQKVKSLLEKVFLWLDKMQSCFENSQWTADAAELRLKSALEPVGQFNPGLRDLLEKESGLILASCPIPMVPCHGDFVLSNIWITSAGNVCPVDWEEATERGWPLLDITFFALDLSLKNHRLAGDHTVSECLHTYLGRIGKILMIPDDLVAPLVRSGVCHLFARLAERGAEPDVLERLSSALERNIAGSRPLQFL